MSSSPIYNSSLGFSRVFFGLMVLASFFLQSRMLVFAIGVFLAAAVSLKYNVVYQCHVLSLRKRFRLTDEPLARDARGLSLAWAIQASLLLIPTLLFLLTKKYLDLAWVLVLLDSLLLILVGLVDFNFAFLSRLFLRKKTVAPKKKTRRPKSGVTPPKEIFQEMKPE